MKFFRSKGYLSKTSDVPSERNPGSSSSTKRVRPLTYREPMRFETRKYNARPGEHKLASGVNNAPMGEK